MKIDRLFIQGANDTDFVPVDKVFGYHLKWRVLSAPEAKTYYEEIPGANGSYDGTEDYGEVFYKDRTISLNCKFADDDWHENYKRFCSKYHAQLVKILFGNDPAYYWYGRLFVEEYNAQEHSLMMSATVYPYKFWMHETIVNSSGNETVRLFADRMKVVPKVTISGAVSLAWKTYTKSLSSASYPATFTIAGLELQNGSLDVTITGAATVSFKYREGSL